MKRKYLICLILIMICFIISVYSIGSLEAIVINTTEEYKNQQDNVYKVFESPSSSNKYMKTAQQKSTHSGEHKTLDAVGNKYYWKNNADIGNPSQGGYGNFKTYYKNGEVWQYTFNNKTVVDTVQFQVLDKKIENIPKDTVLFCIEPLKLAEWIDNTKKENNAYNKLSQKEKESVNNTVSYSVLEFSETGNYDFLAAGQLLVWKDVGATNIKIPKSLNSEWEKLSKDVENSKVIPSFSDSVVKLEYNSKNEYYEANILDSNEVLDERYLKDFLGEYGNLVIEDGPENNDLYIHTKNNKAVDPVTLTSKYQAGIVKAGTRENIHYESKPIYVNSGQDLVAGLSNEYISSFSVVTKEALGKVHLIKGYQKENKAYPLPKAEFGLYDTNNVLLDQKMTDKNGEIYFSDLKLGDYYIQEIKAPKGYAIDKNKYNFSIEKDNEIVEINKGKYIINKPKKGKLLIKKEDSISHEPLIGASFNVYQDSNNNGVLDKEDIKIKKNLITDENGEIEIELVYGNYLIQETKAPEGYKSNNNEIYKVKINDSKNMEKIIIDNKKIKDNKLVFTGQDRKNLIIVIILVSSSGILLILNYKLK